MYGAERQTVGEPGHDSVSPHRADMSDRSPLEDALDRLGAVARRVVIGVECQRGPFPSPSTSAGVRPTEVLLVSALGRPSTTWAGARRGERCELIRGLMGVVHNSPISVGRPLGLPVRSSTRSSRALPSGSSMAEVAR